jgi:hypothetical protein
MEWHKTERASKGSQRQATIKKEERADRQLRSEQQKTGQLANRDRKQAKTLASQRRRLEFTRGRDQQDQRMRQIETRLSSINQIVKANVGTDK